ncbi:MAG TPA: serine hydrolase domain-containing protein [Vicinamibacterales bacterium]|nr:serine hydrolase domain-containing protein [Vicinamibacterales bacterium]
MTATAVAAAGQILRGAIAARVFPAAAVEVGSSTGAIWRSALGTLTFDEVGSAATTDTIFDLASLTKPMATTSVALLLDADRRLPLETPIAAIVPEWRGADREPVTIRHLLEHASGLSARLLDRPPHTARAFEHDICAMPLEYPAGSRSLYSDLGFILLGFCCEVRGGAALEALTAGVLAPLLAPSAGTELFTSVPPAERVRTAPTTPLLEDERRGRRLVGEVHDNYAAALGGFAGHAGLFGTVGGVGLFARTVLRALAGHDAQPPFTAATLRPAVARSRVPGSSRACGWDTMIATSSCGPRMSSSAFGHVGFTGTSLWIDPMKDRYFVLLTNRVCGGGTSEEMQRVRRAFHEAVADL